MMRTGWIFPAVFSLCISAGCGKEAPMEEKETEKPVETTAAPEPVELPDDLAAVVARAGEEFGGISAEKRFETRLAELKEQRGMNAAVELIRLHVDRARELAAEYRCEFSVEFDVGYDGGSTSLWIESESSRLEGIPDLDVFQRQRGGGRAIEGLLSMWHEEGGKEKWPLYEWKCNLCGYEWSSHEAKNRAPCPSCGSKEAPYYPREHAYYYDFELRYDPKKNPFGDNFQQTEPVRLPVPIDLRRCRRFLSWDDRRTVAKYGYDDFPDVRLTPAGTLVQTQDPIICLSDSSRHDQRFLRVVRLTGKVMEEEPERMRSPEP